MQIWSGDRGRLDAAMRMSELVALAADFYVARKQFAAMLSQAARVFYRGCQASDGSEADSPS